jgi:hypothetical protein
LTRVIQPDLCRLLVLALNGLVDLAPVNRDLARRIDSKAYLVAAHIYDGHNDIVAYDDALVALS